MVDSTPRLTDFLEATGRVLSAVAALTVLPRLAEELGRLSEEAASSRGEDKPKPTVDVLVVGCGGVGAWCTAFHAFAGFRTCVVDFDVVDEKWLNRFTLAKLVPRQFTLNAHKVEVTKSVLSIMGFNVEAVARRIEEVSGIVPKVGVICTDTVQSRLKAEEYLKRVGAKFYHVACDANRVNVFTSIGGEIEVIDEQTIRQMTGSSYLNPPEPHVFMCAGCLSMLLTSHLLEREVNVIVHP